MVSGAGGAGPGGLRVGDRHNQWRTHRADSLACRAGHAFAAEELHIGRCGPVIDLARAVAARAGLVTPRPRECDLAGFSGTCAAHDDILAE